MDKPFDFYNYMATIAQHNRFAIDHNFLSCTASGIQGLEEPLQRYRSTANFICTSDISDEATFLRSGGWFRRRSVMVFLLMRYRVGDESDRREKMDDCRELLRQIQSRIVRDNQQLVTEDLYLNIDTFRASELGSAFLNGCTGLYFMLSLDEPTSLNYQPSEWTD